MKMVLGLPHTPQYYELKKKRMALPISQYQAKIMELLERDDIPAMVIVGETGCGKSTQVSQILMSTKNMKKFRFHNGVSILLIKMLIWVHVKQLHAVSQGVLQQ